MDRKNLAYTGGAETRAKPGAKPKAKRPKRGVDAIDPSRRPPGVIDGRVRGNAKHELVGGLLSDGIRHPSWKEIVRRATALDLLDNPAIKYRQAMLAHVCVGTALYFPLLSPTRRLGVCWDGGGASTAAATTCSGRTSRAATWPTN